MRNKMFAMVCVVCLVAALFCGCGKAKETEKLPVETTEAMENQGAIELPMIPVP